MKYVAIDIETTGLSFKKDKILGIGAGENYYVNCIPTELLKPATAHNGKFELKFLRANNLPFKWEFDTLLASSILLDRPKDLDLASVAQHYLGTESWKSDTDKLFKKKNWVELLQQSPDLQQALASRNVYDLKATTALTEVLLHRLEKEGMSKFFFDKLMPAARLLADMEYRGMRIDVDKTKEKLIQTEKQINELLIQLDNWVGPVFTYQEGKTTKEVDLGPFSKEEWDKAILEWHMFDKTEGLPLNFIQYPRFNEKKPQRKTKLEHTPIYKIVNKINWNSPAQVKRFLKAKGYDLWIWDFKKREMVESTGAESLERLLPNPNIQLLLNYKEAVKSKGFLIGWLEDQIDGYLYPSYNLAATRTFRLSCSGPNLQQVPHDKSFRELFIPNPGKVFVIADQAQVEPRFAAHYSGDPTLTEVFTGELDFYGSIAVNVLGVKCSPNEVKAKFPEMRKVAKEIGLSILYGIGAGKLSTIIKKKAGIEFTKEECTAIIKEYFKAYPGLLTFRNYVINKIERGEVLETHYGRKFKLDPEKSFSTGINTVIQSSASDAVLFSQLQIEEELMKVNIEAPLVALIHDEAIRQCDPKDAEVVKQIMIKCMTNQGINCPLKLDVAIGDNWAAK